MSTRSETYQSFTPPRRVQILASDSATRAYFKVGQFAYALAVDTGGGMHCVDRGESRPGERAYLVSKTKLMRGGALWFSESGIRFTARRGTIKRGDRARYGDQRACVKCGTDIEFHGRGTGWIDRGSGTRCLPYRDRQGEVVTPKGKHRPHKG